MTSWNRGHENEEKGERQMHNPDLGDKVIGAARKIAGEIEQGVDNVRDKLTGKQQDWKGEERNPGVEAGDWVENRGEDIKRTSRDVADKVDRGVDDIRDTMSDTERNLEREGRDVADTFDRAADDIGDTMSDTGRNLEREGRDLGNDIERNTR